MKLIDFLQDNNLKLTVKCRDKFDYNACFDEKDCEILFVKDPGFLYGLHDKNWHVAPWLAVRNFLWEIRGAGIIVYPFDHGTRKDLGRPHFGHTIFDANEYNELDVAGLIVKTGEWE